MLFQRRGSRHRTQYTLRKDLSYHEQTLASMMIGFNGPELPAFVNDMQRDSKSLGRDWCGFIPPCNYIMRDNYSMKHINDYDKIIGKHAL